MRCKGVEMQQKLQIKIVLGLQGKQAGVGSIAGEQAELPVSNSIPL